MLKRTLLIGAWYFIFHSPVVRAEGAEHASAAAPPTVGQAGAAPTTKSKPLSDQDWRYGFSTVVIDDVKYDGKVPVKDYDPQKPDEPWSALSDRYLRLHDRAGGHFYYRFIGQFYDDKKADALLTRVYREAKFISQRNPRYPPSVLTLGALLVSDHYTCTLDHSYPALRYADWIAEVEGNLYAAKEAGCKNGKKSKTITVVDCSGVKTLFTDTMTSPCEDVSPTIAWIYPMSPGYVAIKQEYSAAGDEVESSFRVYDVAKKKAVEKLKGGGAWTGDGGSFRDFKDQDGDGIPEVVEKDGKEGSGCVIKHLQKWNGQRLVTVQ